MTQDEIEKALEAHSQQIKEYLKKKRSDKGTTRKSYKSILPTRYLSYLKRANAKRLPFNMTIEEFDTIIQKDCSYCGEKEGLKSVDRIKPELGYTHGNIQSLCGFCNQLKWDNQEDVFLTHIGKIYHHLTKK